MLARFGWLTDGLALVAAEVVHHHDVTGRERRNEDALDIGAEDVAVDRAIEYPGRVDPVVAKGSDEGRCVPMTERGRAWQTLASRRPASERLHVRLYPSLINEDQSRWIDLALMSSPPLAAALYVRTLAFVGDQRLFLKLNPQPRRNRHTVSWLTITPRSASRLCIPMDPDARSNDIRTAIPEYPDKLRRRR